MINELGKDERLTKSAVRQLLEYLKTGKELNEQAKRNLRLFVRLFFKITLFLIGARKAEKRKPVFRAKQRGFFSLTYCLKLVLIKIE
jgi:hypothetical protein